MLRIQLTPIHREELERISGRTAEGSIVQRAQMVLLSDEGYRVQQIAESQQCSKEIV